MGVRFATLCSALSSDWKFVHHDLKFHKILAPAVCALSLDLLEQIVFHLPADIVDNICYFYPDKISDSDFWTDVAALITERELNVECIPMSEARMAENNT